MMTFVQKMNKLVSLMPQLKNYSITLLTFLMIEDPEGHGVQLKQSYILTKTGLCQRSLQLAIKELEGKGLIEREGKKMPVFTVNLYPENSFLHTIQYQQELGQR